MRIRKLQLLTALLFTSPLLAQAAPPHYPDLVSNGNRWTITAYDDSSTTHNQWATQGICFYYAGTQGTQQLYYWVSDTFPDWNGRATQEGDQIVLHGDYARDVGHDGIQFEITTSSPKNEGFGHWHEWREDGKLGTTIGFLNTKLTRVGRCRAPTTLEAIDEGAKIELRLNESKEIAVTPIGLSERQVLELTKEIQ